MKAKKLIWGFLFILAGVLLILHRLNVLNVDIFFNGWWTLFIIIPSFIGLLTDKDKLSNLFVLLIGVFLLLGVNNIIDINLLLKLIFPIILIFIGLSIIFNNINNKDIDKDIREINQSNSDVRKSIAIFSEQNVNFQKEEFKGIDVVAVFGSSNLDLRNIKLASNQVINVVTIFGGLDIITDESYNISVRETSVFGGIDDSRTNSQKDDKKKTIIINAICVFGGVDIK